MTTTPTPKPNGKFAALAEAAAVAATTVTSPGATSTSYAILIDAMTALVEESRKRDEIELALREENRQLKEDIRRLPGAINAIVSSALAPTIAALEELDKKITTIDVNTAVSEERSCITQALSFAILGVLVASILVWRFWPGAAGGGNP